MIAATHDLSVLLAGALVGALLVWCLWLAVEIDLSRHRYRRQVGGGDLPSSLPVFGGAPPSEGGKQAAAEQPGGLEEGRSPLTD